MLFIELVGLPKIKGDGLRAKFGIGLKRSQRRMKKAAKQAVQEVFNGKDNNKHYKETLMRHGRFIICCNTRFVIYLSGIEPVHDNCIYSDVFITKKYFDEINTIIVMIRSMINNNDEKFNIGLICKCDNEEELIVANKVYDAFSNRSSKIQNDKLNFNMIIKK